MQVTTSGTRLLDEAAVELLASQIFPRSTLVTPNLQEARHTPACAPSDRRQARSHAMVTLSAGGEPGMSWPVPEMAGSRLIHA